MWLWKKFTDGRTGTEVFRDLLPTLLIIGVLYAFSVTVAIAQPGFVPTGYEKQADESENALQWGVVGEKMKIFSLELHYSGTNDSETSFYLSWYFLNACIRPKNGTDAEPGMCQKRIAWNSVNLDALLTSADRINDLLSGFNITGYVPGSQPHPSQTHEAVLAARLTMQSGTTFVLLIWSAILALGSWFAFWICPRRWTLIPLTMLGGALAMVTGGAGILQMTTHHLITRAMTIDSEFAQHPKAGATFFGLLWSIVAMLVVAFICAVGDVALGAREDEVDSMFRRFERNLFKRDAPKSNDNGRGMTTHTESWWSRALWRGKRPAISSNDPPGAQHPELGWLGGPTYHECSQVESADDMSLNQVEKKY